MKLMNRIFAFLAGCLIAHGTAAASPWVEFRGTSILLTDGDLSFELEQQIDPDAFFTTLHAVSQRGADYYIVYGTSEMSRGWPPRNGRCGSGIESYIRWLHVREGKIITTAEGLYESCFRDRYGGEIKWKDQKLHWGTEGFDALPNDPNNRQRVDYEWTFDPAHPEQGISESAQPKP